MNDFIRRRLSEQPRSLLLQILLAMAFVALATLARLVLTPLVGDGLPYITYFPGLVLTAVMAGPRAGVVFLFAAPLAVACFVLPPFAVFELHRAEWTGIGAFLVAGGMILWLCEQLTRAVHDLDAAHTQEHLLVLELHHRVKNMLAVVQSLAAQTFTSTGGGVSFKAAFTERLIALGRAQNVLNELGGGGVPIGELVQRTVEPFFGAEPDRLDAGGEAVNLPADLVVDLALCLHELATNATKHGALTEPAGRVEIRWRRLGGQRVELTWQERGGPAVGDPKRRGFGTRLLERGLSRKANPEARSDYRPDGLVWTVRFDGAEA